MQSTKKKIAIATPSNGSVRCEYVKSLLGLIRYTEYEWIYLGVEGSILPKNRARLAEEAIACGCTHMLFIDSDMGFPEDTLDVLIGHNAHVVAANCVTRAKGKVRYLAEKIIPGEKVARNISSDGKSGIEEVDFIGTGVMLIDLSVFGGMPKPWFIFGYTGDRYIGEDIWFCSACSAMGYRIYIDHDLSQKITHVGTYGYGVEDVE
jgi:hypothetical protein